MGFKPDNECKKQYIMKTKLLRKIRNEVRKIYPWQCPDKAMILRFSKIYQKAMIKKYQHAFTHEKAKWKRSIQN